VDFLASFHLPGVADKHDRLKDENPLPRDRRIVFHEEKHEYFCDNVKAPRSVTGLVHTYGWEFDPHAAVQAMKNGARWPEKRASFMTDSGTEMSDGEIVEMWKSSGQIASARGTLLHYHCEMHLNQRRLEPPHSPEFKMFLAIFAVLQSWGLRPFRTEISLFHNGLCLAGPCMPRRDAGPSCPAILPYMAGGPAMRRCDGGPSCPAVLPCLAGSFAMCLWRSIPPCRPAIHGGPSCHGRGYGGPSCPAILPYGGWRARRAWRTLR
jgi:hypothetical protein